MTLSPHLQRQRHWCDTADGWRLQLLSFAPEQTSFSWPWLCIHGFSQSHRTWTAGGFAQDLSALGCHVYVLDLRGHGDSVRANQRNPLPSDIDSGWDVDAYFSQDLPAAISFIQSQHPGEKIVLCGHSMGGIMATAATIQRREAGIAALVPIAAPMSPSKMSRRVRLAAAASRIASPTARRARIPWRQLPMAHFFAFLERLYFADKRARRRFLPMLAPFDQWQLLPRVWTPAHMKDAVIRDILRNTYPEPMAVVEQFARWIKDDALYLGAPMERDYSRGFHHITVPVVAAWGEADVLAPPATGEIFRDQIRSPWQHHLFLPEAHHVDITAGTPAQMILHAIQRMLAQCAP